MQQRVETYRLNPHRTKFAGVAKWNGNRLLTGISWVRIPSPVLWPRGRMVEILAFQAGGGGFESPWGRFLRIGVVVTRLVLTQEREVRFLYPQLTVYSLMDRVLRYERRDLVSITGRLMLFYLNKWLNMAPWSNGEIQDSQSCGGGFKSPRRRFCELVQW